jgi:O-antigen/teichoic acid export membrane protein
LFSSLIARQEYVELDEIFTKTLKQVSGMCLLCILGFIGTLNILNNFYPKLGGRFLSLLPTILLCIAIFTNQFVGAFATYLRCHKKEPFLVLSMIMAAACALSTLLAGKFYGVIGITAGYSFLVVVVSLPYAYTIYVRKKKLWH